MKTKEQRMQENLERIKNFRLLDDDFMTKCFENNIECTELLLGIILSKPDLKVHKVVTQYTMKNLQGRSVRLDIYATDSEGKKYNIEIQRDGKGAGRKRARYFKEEKEGIETMCQAMEELRNESLKEGMEEGQKAVALKLLKEGTLTIEKIAECCNLSLEEVKVLQKSSR